MFPGNGFHRYEPSYRLQNKKETTSLGYVFENASAITPYLEHPRTGITSQFCSELAKKLHCYVVAGFPEKLSLEELAETKTSSSPVLTKIEQVGANSAVLCGPDGEWIGGYRKTHLFQTDLTWAKPGMLSIPSPLSLSYYNSLSGTGFATYTLPPPLQTITLGICMDLNPQIPDWSTAEGPYEIADHCISKNSNLLILLNAWLDSGEDLEENHDWQTLNYWAARTRPLWSNGNDDNDSDSSQDASQPSLTSDSGSNETIVVICNRSGQENGLFISFVSFQKCLSSSHRENIRRKLSHLQHATCFRSS